MIGWLADYSGSVRLHQHPPGRRQHPGREQLNYAYLNNSAYNARMKQAAKLSGDARYKAYGNLDVDLMKNLAPWAPFVNGNTREFVSTRDHELHLPPGLLG